MMDVTLAGSGCKLDASLTVVVAIKESGMLLASVDEFPRKRSANAWRRV